MFVYMVNDYYIADNGFTYPETGAVTTILGQKCFSTKEKALEALKKFAEKEIEVLNSVLKEQGMGGKFVFSKDSQKFRPAMDVAQDYVIRYTGKDVKPEEGEWAIAYDFSLIELEEE